MCSRLFLTFLCCLTCLIYLSLSGDQLQDQRQEDLLEQQRLDTKRQDANIQKRVQEKARVNQQAQEDARWRRQLEDKEYQRKQWENQHYR